jgi:hypothetical protein
MTTKADANRVLKSLGMPALKRAQAGAGRKKRPRRYKTMPYRGQRGDGFFDVLQSVGKTALRGLDAVGLKPSDVIKYGGTLTGNRRISQAGNLLGRVGYGHCGAKPRARRRRRR